MTSNTTKCFTKIDVELKCSYRYAIRVYEELVYWLLKIENIETAYNRHRYIKGLDPDHVGDYNIVIEGFTKHDEDVLEMKVRDIINPVNDVVFNELYKAGEAVTNCVLMKCSISNDNTRTKRL
ncbi:MAG: hypothetical protein GY746_13000 [Gammaproteobacteria bacterium]|nr:hypothetical protein [Gammaproteobacteria bacterium]